MDGNNRERTSDGRKEMQRPDKIEDVNKETHVGMGEAPQRGLGNCVGL